MNEVITINITKKYPFYLGLFYPFVICFGLFSPRGTSTTLYIITSFGILVYEYVIRRNRLHLSVVLSFLFFMFMVFYSLLNSGLRNVQINYIAFNYFFTGSIISLTIIAAIRYQRIRFIYFTKGLLYMISAIALLSLIDYFIAKIFRIELISSAYDMIIGYRPGKKMSTIAHIRLAGTMGNPNYLAIVFLTAFSILLGLFNEQRQKKRIWVLFYLMVTSIVFTGTRTVVAAMILMVFLFMIIKGLSKKYTDLSKFILYNLIFILTTIIMLSFSTFFTSEIIRLPEFINRYTDLSITLNTADQNRGELWSAYIHNIIDNETGILFGYGFANYFDIGRKPHNTYLRSILDFGFIGGILFITYFINLVLRLFYLNLKNSENSEYAVAFFSMSALLVSCLGNDYIDFRIFWVTLGIALSVLKIEQEPKYYTKSQYHPIRCFEN